MMPIPPNKPFQWLSKFWLLRLSSAPPVILLAGMILGGLIWVAFPQVTAMALGLTNQPPNQPVTAVSESEKSQSVKSGPVKSGADKEEQERLEKLRIRASWDADKVNRFIDTTQRAAIEVQKQCNNDCIAFCRCLADNLVETIPYSAYIQYIGDPVRFSDLSPEEKKAFTAYNQQFDELSNRCARQVQESEAKNTTLGGLELLSRQLDNQELAEGRQSHWVELYRRADMILQIDMSRVENTVNKSGNPLKTLWLRQFSPSFDGNYVLSQTTLDCTDKSQVTSHYSVITPQGKEVFGDHLPSPVTPLNLHDKAGEDLKLYRQFCPAPTTTSR